MFIKSSVIGVNNKVSVNGVTIDVPHNATVNVINGKVYVNGKQYNNEKTNNKEFVNLIIYGNVSNVSCGDGITINGDVTGDIEAGSSVNITGNVIGNIDSGSSVNITGKHEGTIDAGGSVKVLYNKM